MRKSKVLQYIIQIIGWGIVFGFPLFFTWKEADPLTWVKYLGYVCVPVFSMIIFYFNYFVLIDRVLFARGLIQFLLVNLLLFVVLSLLLDVWYGYYFVHVLGDKHHHGGPPNIMFVLRNCLTMALTAALSVAIRMTEKWHTIEDEKKELEKARAEAELQNLKSQLNPHFLFNTLNNIYSLIAIDPDRAQYAVHDLSRLLRHVLYEDRQPFVSLDQELVFMKSYIELMGLRFSDKVDLRVELPVDGKGILVAPFLFITLIENAFKHGVSPTEKSFVHI
ncbi:MAG: histidine kinase, partial [Odoribacter sp.]|nr:histidine kinase [Odoribacter sp.]